MTTTSALSTANMNSWLELEALKDGVDHQRERYTAGVLPEDELTLLARNVLFAPFEGNSPRWATNRMRERMVRDLRHGRSCRVLVADESLGTVKFETLPVGDLNPQEWENLKRINISSDIARRHEWLVKSGGKVLVLAVTHWATCSECEGETCRSSAKVVIEWAGRELVREFAL